ncbi:MAG: hypothetical protein GX100_13705, partial [candidate division WS1 bacterium]|nr:hypothetical protein [candidate division WS1 bacterium]
ALMDARGRFLREGQPYLVLGLYHVAPAEFASIAKAGFNVAVTAPPASAEELQATVQAAREAKLAVAVPLYPALQDSTAAEAALELVKAQSGNLGIFGWLLADEPELKPAQAGALPDLYLRVRQADDVHPALLNLGPGADLAVWAPLADALLVSLLPGKDERPEAVGKRIQTVAAALRESNQSWIGVLPAGWSGYIPTTARARSYLYQLLAAGAQGVFWFSLREGKWDLTKAPLWEDLPKLNAEAQELAEALTEAQEWSELEVSVKGVTARGAKRGPQAWLLLFNSTDEAVSGYLRVPEPVAEAEYLDGGQLKVNNRTLNFEVPGAGARAVRLSLEAKPATTPPP